MLTIDGERLFTEREVIAALTAVSDDLVEEVGRLTLALGKAEAERDEARDERDRYRDEADRADRAESVALDRADRYREALERIVMTMDPDVRKIARAALNETQETPDGVDPRVPSERVAPAAPRGEPSDLSGETQEQG